MRTTKKYDDLVAGLEVSTQVSDSYRTSEHETSHVGTGYNSDLQLALLLIKLDAELAFESMKKSK